MIITVLLVWIGVKLSMPTMYYVLCATSLFLKFISATINVSKEK